MSTTLKYLNLKQVGFLIDLNSLFTHNKPMVQIHQGMSSPFAEQIARQHLVHLLLGRYIFEVT